MQLPTRFEEASEIITYPWINDIQSSLIVQAITYSMCANNSLNQRITLAGLSNNSFKDFPSALVSKTNYMKRTKLIYKAEVLSDMQVHKNNRSISLVLRVVKCNTHDNANIDCKERIIALLPAAQLVFHGFKINESIRFFFEK